MSGDERLREERATTDPDYDRHGGFPLFEAAEPGPGFGPFLTAMRRLQDLAVSADPDCPGVRICLAEARGRVSFQGRVPSDERRLPMVGMV